ncbi:hypothetical protein SAY86_001198 [Trapa natans]|uniref:Uncharacterized protein n=1 Tax=Trapa natans TaxID=22666 RepID=A0AAN7MBL7_TRANT|nr:hypothetical protein SAY86_001198 [Trapa natans]
MELQPPANPSISSSSRSLLSPKGSDDSGLQKSPFSSSSSSSSSLFSLSQSPLSPSLSSRLSSGVPFSWEKLPGIPKRQTSLSGSRRNTGDEFAGQQSLKLLPLPPSAAPARRPRSIQQRPEVSFRKKVSPEWDPFIAALVECSKDDGDGSQDEDADIRSSLWISAKVSRRSIVDHLGFIGLYDSCKTSCLVDESIIRLRRPSTERGRRRQQPCLPTSSSTTITMDPMKS